MCKYRLQNGGHFVLPPICPRVETIGREMSNIEHLEFLNKLYEIASIPDVTLGNFWLISPWTKWPPFRRRYFQMHVRVWRSYTTIENSYFIMTLSCTEAIQSFISHFNQYSLVDPSWGNIPSWVWQGVSHWFRKLRRRVWRHRYFGNWISWQ